MAARLPFCLERQWHEASDMPMKIGYVCISAATPETAFKALEAQLRELKAAGVGQVFQEQLPSVNAKRARLEAAIERCRKGDVLVCSTLTKLANSVAGLVVIEKRLRDKGAPLRVIDLNIDTATENGRWVFTIFAAIAEFEREVALTRQREGIARAKGEGKYKGRPATARAKSAEVLAMHKDRVSATEIAKTLKIGRRSVYRILEDSLSPVINNGVRSISFGPLSCICGCLAADTEPTPGNYSPKPASEQVVRPVRVITGKAQLEQM
jgi:DNA invertase Pin-like site-specific DNA recombinase